MAEKEDHYHHARLLGQEDFDVWQIQMEALLRQKKLWGIVDGSETLAEGAEEPAITNFADRKQDAYAKLVLSLGKKVVKVVLLYTLLYIDLKK